MIRGLVLLSIPLLSFLHTASVFAFTAIDLQPKPFHRSRERRRTAFIAQMATNDETDSLTWSPIQLWLDLRGTAITPNMALSRLDSPLPVDGVIVSSQQHVALQSDYTMFYVDEDEKLLCNLADPSQVNGTVVTVNDESVFIDPIPALDATTRGAWVLVDSQQTRDDDSVRHEAISSLVDFLIGGSSSDSLLLGTDSQSSTESSEKGGIAIACQTRADVVHAATALKSIDSSSLVTTESGILLATTSEEVCASTLDASLRAALVLPFDPPLWKTAAVVQMTES